jgi:hypothetical protein
MVGVPFLVEYVIQNLTLHLAELVAFSESSDHFVFSGMKLLHFRILPLATYTLKYNVLPLIIGKFSLPQVKVIKKADIQTGDENISTRMSVDKLFPVKCPLTMLTPSNEIVVNVGPKPCFDLQLVA